MNKINLLAILVIVVAIGCSPNSDTLIVEDNSSGLTKLAGNDGGAAYYVYDKTAYETAVSQNKTVYLEFYASWCPVCKQMEPEIVAAFNELENPNIIGFRVNYDTETSLKKQFQIPYQHTRVIIKNGVQVQKSSNAWTKEQIKEALV